MLSIRLQRTGKHKAPHFRVIVTEKRRDPFGKHVEILGNINPRTKETNLKEDRIKYWLGVGAQPTNAMRNLLIRAGLLEGKKAKAVRITKKRQAKMSEKEAEAAEKAKEAKEAAEAEKAEAEAAEAPAEEAAPEAPAEADAPAEEAEAEAPAEAAPEAAPAE